jgi:putative RecB family exonuclease
MSIPSSLDFDHKSRLPAKLSPSRAKDFLQCPRLFYYKTILGLSTPSSFATVSGTLAHHAFERIFDHDKPYRTPDTAVSYVRPAWNMLTTPFVSLDDVSPDDPEFSLRKTNKLFLEHLQDNPNDYTRAERVAQDYLTVASTDSQVSELITSTESKVKSWFAMENPQKFDPFEREKYVFAKLKKVTAHGFIDRVDKITNSKGTFWYISDFKTGKMPAPRFVDDAFFQLEVYALCLYKMINVVPTELRLVYVAKNDPSGVLSRKVSQSMLSQTERKLNSIWSSIDSCATSGSWPAKKQTLCSWCPFQSVCPAHTPGLEGLLPEEIAARTETFLL